MKHYEKLERDQRRGLDPLGPNDSERSRSSRRPSHMNTVDSTPERSARRTTITATVEATERVRTMSDMPNQEPRSRRPSMSEASTSTRRPSTSMIRNSSCVQDEHLSAQLFAVVPDGRLIFSCGHWDHSFRATSLDTGRLVQNITQHSDVVTCVACARDFGRYWLVTGSRDCTLMVWEINLERDLPLGTQPLHILYGHDDAITTVAINPEFDVIISGSDDGTIIVHNLHSGVYVRSIVLSSPKSVPIAVSAVPLPTTPSTLTSPSTTPRSRAEALPVAASAQPIATASAVSTAAGSGGPQQRRITWVGLSREAFICAYSVDDQTLTTYTINGTFVASKVVPERLYAFAISEDGKVLVTGGDSCLVVLRWVRIFCCCEVSNSLIFVTFFPFSDSKS